MNSSTQQNNDSHPTPHKLPAVKLIINKNATKRYSNPIKLSEEIFTHKKINKENSYHSSTASFSSPLTMKTLTKSY